MKAQPGKFFFLIGLIFLLTLPTYAQKQGRIVQKAEKKARRGEYQSAIDLYQKITLNEKNVAEINYNIAEAYRLSNRVHLSRDYYLKALEAGGEFENAKFYLGHAYKVNNQYEEAMASFTQYLEKGSETQYWDKAKLEIKNLADMQRILEDESKKNEYIDIMTIDTLNSEGSDYSPFLAKDSLGRNTKLYFTGTRDEEIYWAIGYGYSRLYVMNLEDTFKNTGTVEKVKIPLVFEKANYNVGTVTMSNDGKTIIFARGNSGRRRDKIKEVSLFMSEYVDSTESWSEPQQLPFSNPKTWDSTPAFSRNGSTLYFSSNRGGGYGGIDLWSVKRRRDGTWDQPRNMGSKINTTSNEMFPYVSERGALYFASDGHPGFGGLDIFEATRKDNRTSIDNLGLNFNTSYDDFGLIWRDTISGYLSSNRPGGKGSDDIYFFLDRTPPKFDFFVEVGIRYQDDGGDKDGNFFAGEPILGANVKVMRRKPPKELKVGELETIKTDLLSKFEKSVEDSLVEVLAADVKDSLVSQYAANISETIEEKLQEETEGPLAREYVLNVKDSIVQMYEKQVTDSLANSLAEVISETKDSLVTAYANIVQDSLENPSNDEFEEVGEFTTGKYGKLKFQMDPSTEYQFVMAKEGTLTKRVTFTSPDKKDIPIEELVSIGIKDTTFREEYELDRPEVGDIISMRKGKNAYDFEEIYYDFDSYYFDEKENPQLEKLVTFLNDNPQIRVELSSHCDERGSDIYNILLSQKRAKFVIDYLRGRDISKEQIYGRGYGTFQLRVENAETEEEHQENRRTELKIIEILDLKSEEEMAADKNEELKGGEKKEEVSQKEEDPQPPIEQKPAQE